MSDIKRYVAVELTKLHDEYEVVDLDMIVESSFRGLEVIVGQPLGAPLMREMVEEWIKKAAREIWRRRTGGFDIDGRFPPPGTPNYLTIRRLGNEWGHVRWDQSRAEHWIAHDEVLREKKSEVDESIDEFQHAKDVVLPELQRTGKTLGQLVIEYTFSDGAA